MKHIKYIIICLILIMFFPLGVFAKDVSYDDAIKAVQEVMRSYYIRGQNIQYNYAKTGYPIGAPEEATSQDTNYSVCAAFTYSVYTEAFGMYHNNDSKLPLFPYYDAAGVKQSGVFPRYVDSEIIPAARDYYNNKNSRDGTFLIYYQKQPTKSEKNGCEEIFPDITSAEYNDCITKYKKKYFYKQEETAPGSTGDLEKLIEIVKPGDIFAYSGHALIAYDVLINPTTGKQDVLLLNATQSEFIPNRIESTSKLSYNIFPSPFFLSDTYKDKTKLPLKYIREGTIQLRWLSETNQFILEAANGTKHLSCKENECVVIRPFYANGDNASFNYVITDDFTQYNKSTLRVEYPGLKIEKTSSVGDNTSVYVSDEIEYTIKITNESDITPQNTKPYDGFIIKETLSDKVEYVESSHNSKLENGIITWNIETILKKGMSMTLTYKVKVKNNLKNVGEEFKAEGGFYKIEEDGSSSDIFISTGVVKHKIIPKVTDPSTKYNTCYVDVLNNPDKYKIDKKEEIIGLNLINKIYQCARGKALSWEDFGLEQSEIKLLKGRDFSFTNFDFDNMFYMDYDESKLKSSARLYFKEDELYDFEKGEPKNKIKLNTADELKAYSEAVTAESKIFKKMILDKYYGGLLNYNGKYYLPVLTSKRARTINYNGLKTGDILIYYVDGGKTTQETGIYAFMYVATNNLKTRWIGRNYSEKLMRNAFSANYYGNSIFDNLYEGYDNMSDYGFKKNGILYSYPTDTTGNKIFGLSESEKNQVLEYVNLQTLYDKNYFVILRPELAIKEIAEIKIDDSALPTKTSYIQMVDEKLELEGGILTIVYNDGSEVYKDLVDSSISVTGYSKYSEPGDKVITVSYGGKTTTFTIEVKPLEYNITLEFGDGKTTTRTVTYNSKYGTLPTPTKNGYTFDGWYLEKDYITEIQSTTTVSKTENHSLYAKWSVNKYKVTFDTVGGTSLATRTVTYNSKYGTLPTPTKSGYTFDGWYLEKDYNNKITKDSKVLTTSDHKLYAKWVELYTYIIDKYVHNKDKKLIDFIDINTTVDDFVKNIKFNTGYTVDVSYVTINKKKLLYTGGKTKIFNNGLLYEECTNIIRGEVNGDGKIDYSDYVKIYNHIYKTKNPSSTKKLLTNEYLLAADISGDTKIDYVKVYNKIKELKGETN